MTPTLIDQLKLAIQVESGELEWTDTECRRKNGEQWEAPIVRSLKDGQIKPVWNFELFEYRRKPKPLELWVNIREDGLMRCFDCVQGAIGDSRARAANDEMPDRAVAVHMREVTND